MRHARTHRRTSGRTAAVGLLAAGAMVLAGCADDPEATEPEQTDVVENGETPEDDTMDDGATDDGAADEDAQEDGAFDDILENPDAFIGQDVTIEGEVAAVISPTAFTIVRLTTIPLLVVVDEDGAPEGLEIGDTVEVSGTMQEDFDASQVEDGEEPLIEAHQGETYVEADSVEVR